MQAPFISRFTRWLGEIMNEANDKTRKPKKVPYGLSDYEKIVREGYYYVDKTSYLRTLEEVGSYLFFIRPRRFGKSLFLSMMETYYDVSKADRFDLFFRNTHIHRDPTPERNQHLILKFNFAAVDPHRGNIEASFLNNVKTIIRSFLQKYSDHLPSTDKEEFRKEIGGMTSAADVLFRAIHLCKGANRKIYIIIDEYDNFANTILANAGGEAFEDLTHGEGFFRAFFNVVKDGATGSGAPISRLFITGVSPVTMDDVTSGFNIGMNISLDLAFNEMR